MSYKELKANMNRDGRFRRVGIFKYDMACYIIMVLRTAGDESPFTYAAKIVRDAAVTSAKNTILLAKQLDTSKAWKVASNAVQFAESAKRSATFASDPKYNNYDLSEALSQAIRNAENAYAAMQSLKTGTFDEYPVIGSNNVCKKALADFYANN